MNFDTPKLDDIQKELTISEQTDMNITTAKEFADNNSTIPDLPSKDFDKYNKAKLLQSQLPQTYFDKNTTKENIQSELTREKLNNKNI